MLSKNHIVLGVIYLKDIIKDGVKEKFADLRKMGIKTIMITGDNPFLMYGDVTPVQALFESVSGFTTTGLSVLDVEKLPHTFLFYRAFCKSSEMRFLGGLILITIPILSGFLVAGGKMAGDCTCSHDYSHGDWWRLRLYCRWN